MSLPRVFRRKPFGTSTRSTRLSTHLDIAGLRHVILVLMLVFYPFVVVPNIIGYFTLPKYLVLAVLSTIAVWALYKSRLSLNHPAFLFLGSFLAFSLVSTIMAQNPTAAWLGFAGIVSFNVPDPDVGTRHALIARFTGFSTYFFCAVLLLTAYLSTRGDRLLGLMFKAASIVAVLAVLQHFGVNLVPHEPWKEGWRSYGTIGNPNFLATYLVFALPGAILYFLHRREPVWLGCSAIIYMGLLVTLTRGTWLAFALIFVVICIYASRKAQLRKSLALVILTLVVSTGALMPTNEGIIWKRAFSISQEVAAAAAFEEEAGAKRMLIWKETAKQLPQHWLFGMGPDNLVYAEIVLPNQRIADKAHNIYLEIAVTMGLLTLLSFFAFISFFLRKWNSEQGFVFFAMILTYLIQGLFNIDVVAVMPLFWIVLGLALANASRTNQLANHFNPT